MGDPVFTLVFCLMFHHRFVDAFGDVDVINKKIENKKNKLNDTNTPITIHEYKVKYTYRYILVINSMLSYYLLFGHHDSIHEAFS